LANGAEINVKLRVWAPAVLLGIGCFLTADIRPQLTMPLRQPLGDVVPKSFGNTVGLDHTLKQGEVEVAGMSNYLLRTYAPATAKTGNGYDYSIYVGYYDRQTRGKSIHSPKNCLPGGGWQALSSRTEQLASNEGVVRVNRYLLHREGQRAVVLYWYQGRGRTEANEYRVKVNLLRDAALRRRSEEALVRIVVPVRTDEESAYRTAVSLASQLMSAVERALPA
jgi:EpsI family protein